MTHGMARTFAAVPFCPHEEAALEPLSWLG